MYHNFYLWESFACLGSFRVGHFCLIQSLGGKLIFGIHLQLALSRILYCCFLAMKKEESKCPNSFARNIHWSVTQNGHTAYSNCPKGTKGNVVCP